MAPKKTSHKPVRPLRVFVGHKTKAEAGFRKRSSMPDWSLIAPGLPPTPDHDLVYNSSHTIQDLVFANFYVGGSDAWQANDMQSIDQALSAAMSD